MKIEKKGFIFAAVFGILISFTDTAHALTIVGGGLPAAHCLVWTGIAIPFAVTGFFRVKKRLSDNKRSLSMMALSGCLLFVLSALKIPAVPECCSNMTGAGLGSVLFGPFIVSFEAFTVFFLHLIFFRNGGLTTLGANTFSVGVAGSFVTWYVFRKIQERNIGKGRAIAGAVFAGNLISAVVTAIQLSLANADGVADFGNVLFGYIIKFMPTQIPLAAAEGIVVLLVLKGINSFDKSILDGAGFSMSYEEDSEINK